MSQVFAHSLWTDFDINLFKAGKHYRLYEKLGSHIVEREGVWGVYFSVWAPSAKSVSVVGDFNYWTDNEHPLYVRWDSSGIWEGFIPNVGKGTRYKYKIHSHHNGVIVEKADPFARYAEIPPCTASIVWDEEYKWNDSAWMSYRKDKNSLDKPYSVYEVHLGSWRKKNNGSEYLSYQDFANELVEYVTKMGFTHVELLPVMEHPYAPSWGYQSLGYFAPSSRFGVPQDFKYLVDKLHQNNIGVILDWVPSHFPEDDHGLATFDGTHLYEHPDHRRGYHPDWKSLIFNYGRNEVKSFLISSAAFWCDRFHADGLRVDAVASMLYLDYSREDGEWEPNIYGGRENLEAIDFLKEMNAHLYGSFEGIQTIAEESTAFTGVSKPLYDGGLGFGMKWMMGWMHDTLEYFKKDPIYRQHHQNDITFSMTYAFSENFMLPLSHDEVVHGKHSLLYRMPGDEWQRFANLRLMYGYMYTHPGTKLLFMGGEFGQGEEWNAEQSLDWHILQYPVHKGLQTLMKDLNKFYSSYPALYEKQFSSEGFEWISHDDAQNSVIVYMRHGHDTDNNVIIACNMTPTTLQNYRIGLPRQGKLVQKFNTDYKKYGGSGASNKSSITIDTQQWHGRAYSAEISIPPLSMVAFIIR